MGKLAKKIKNSGALGHYVYLAIRGLREVYVNCLHTDKQAIRKKFKKRVGENPDLDHPQTLNEKIQWLKLHDRKDLYTTLVDKFAVREYIAEKFGEEYLIPLYHRFLKAKELTPENITEVPCIIKTNHDSGTYRIIRDKTQVNWRSLRRDFSCNLLVNYYYFSQEWPYKNIKPRCIVVEKLLETKEGKIPNDYKLHYINGELQFIYVSYDREGVNDRCTYDKDWNRLPFLWIPKKSYREGMNTADVPKPKTLEKMIEFGNEVAKDFKYVRVDFYDVDGKLYFGEITLYHGSGMDVFFPEAYDLYYGNKLQLE